MASSGGTGGGTNNTPNGERMRESPNSGARVQAVHTGLKKVVTGRESVIKDQAVKLAEKLDVKTEGKHHQKIRLALLALNSLVDTLGRDGKKQGENAAGAQNSASSTGNGPSKPSPSPSAPNASEPEDIGTFTPRSGKTSK